MIAADVKEELKQRLETLGRPVALTGIIVGEKDADLVYARMREKHCASVGIEARLIKLPADTEMKELLDTIEQLNENREVQGIVVHYPLPSHLDPKQVAGFVSPRKDIDGLHPENMGRLFSGDEKMPPATPAAAIYILKAMGMELKGKEVCVVNHSPVVGKPLSIMLLNRNATVHVCHVFSEDTARWAREADVLITAAGVPGLITTDMVKEGAVVIDVAMNRKDGKLCGDVAYEEVLEKAGAVTPVPGGVGPVTNAMLLRNVVRAAERA